MLLALCLDGSTRLVGRKIRNKDGTRRETNTRKRKKRNKRRGKVREKKGAGRYR